MEDNSGKIKIYGKVIDLYNSPSEDLNKMRKILQNRLLTLFEKYIDLCEEEKNV